MLRVSEKIVIIFLILFFVVQILSTDESVR